MIGRTILAAGVSAAILALSPAWVSAVECDLFHAVYTPLDPESDMSAEAGKPNRYSAQHINKRLRFNQAQFAFRLSEATQNISYDFGFAFANGYGGVSLVFAGRSDRTARHKLHEDDPTSRIIYFDAGLKQTQPDWETGGAAPPYLIMPGMGSSFWYWTPERKFVPPGGMWKATSCAKQ